ncbi:MAG: DNA mismatch repair endonuclease MutL [Bacteroides sp.]|nr:DNA mismatch repair endonuclease MutL [Prevotella sp.]MCM1407793.1 DNA mismatch repair endonuclease MutL [Treponema brennaborense]MCM1468859.1 DNA mismatch repair endonuclease MutL [Bacteroides sp.]
MTDRFQKPERPVMMLAPEVARKIAAGEVIDRPNAVLREFLDNAVDAGATRITAEIEGGGIDKICVADNGIGMTKEDLCACARPHATSKISGEADLMNLSTLGFRGEALASIAAVSRLDITSRRAPDISAWHLETNITEDHVITPAQLECGTIAQSQALFANFPARRVFLKRPAAEGALCRQIFTEKALPFPETAFRLFMDGKLKLDLPSGQSLSERFVSAMNLPGYENLFYELSAEDSSGSKNWTCTIIIGEPAVFRTDKKLIHIYANGRKIQEYSLVQAVEYGAQGYFPNGTHPAAAVFLEMNPALVDFNVHPAKREARFKDLAPVHKAVTQTIRSFFKNYTVSKLVHGGHGKETHYVPAEQETAADTADAAAETNAQAELFRSEFRRQKAVNPQTNRAPRFRQDSFLSSGSCFGGTEARDGGKREMRGIESAESAAMQNFHAAAETSSDAGSAANYLYACENDETQSAGSDFVFLGSALGTFLIAEKDGNLYIVDQHAAHERILFNQMRERAGEKQPLLLPYIIETESAADDAYLESVQTELCGAGFEMKNLGGGSWEIQSVPACWQGTEEDLADDLLNKKQEPQQLLYALFASAACRSAVKDGTVIDSKSACMILEKTFRLPDPHCPHGRPVWTVVTKKELFDRVKRT